MTQTQRLILYELMEALAKAGNEASRDPEFKSLVEGLGIIQGTIDEATQKVGDTVFNYKNKNQEGKTNG